MRVLTFRRLPLAAALAALVLAAAPGLAQPGPGDVGAYLAARLAGQRRDLDASVPYLERLLAAQPEDMAVRERLVMALMSLGEGARAAQLARPLYQVAPNNPAARMALIADAFARRDFAGVLDLTGGAGRAPAAVEALAAAWAHLGQGRMTEALGALEVAAAQPGLGPFAFYCRALMLALAGDAEGALAIIEDPERGVRPALNRRGMLAYAQLLGLAERFDDARALLDEGFGTDPDPAVDRLRRAFAEGRSLPFDLIAGPAEGMAEVYAVLAASIRDPDQRQDTLVFAQAALAINPQLSDARILLAQAFEELGQTARAAEAYARIGPDDSFALVAAIGRANTLEAEGRVEDALAVLEAAEARHPDSLLAPQVLGDALRRAGRHAEARAAYGRAIALHQARGLPIDWRLWFARGVASERSGDWPAAEADFRAALAVDPDQPSVLNYLGYSLVERREKLDEALALIDRAVASEPDAGYIVDSLAWALFRLGRYDEALPHMERAVELMPTDPILNDHLGDIYWAVGRFREAEFQWRRALSFGPHDDLDMDRVRRKIELGLDQVLAEEGAEPLHSGN